MGGLRVSHWTKAGRTFLRVRLLTGQHGVIQQDVDDIGLDPLGVRGQDHAGGHRAQHGVQRQQMADQALVLELLEENRHGGRSDASKSLKASW